MDDRVRFWRWRVGRMSGRSEVVLHAYRQRWDGPRRRYFYSKRPSFRDLPLIHLPQLPALCHPPTHVHGLTNFPHPPIPTPSSLRSSSLRLSHLIRLVFRSEPVSIRVPTAPTWTSSPLLNTLPPPLTTSPPRLLPRRCSNRNGPLRRSVRLGRNMNDEDLLRS